MLLFRELDGRRAGRETCPRPPDGSYRKYYRIRVFLIGKSLSLERSYGLGAESYFLLEIESNILILESTKRDYLITQLPQLSELGQFSC